MRNFIRPLCAIFLGILVSAAVAKEKVVIHKARHLTAQSLGILTTKYFPTQSGTLPEMRITTNLGHSFFIDVTNDLWASRIAVGEEVSLIEYDTDKWVRAMQVCPSQTYHRLYCYEVVRRVEPQIFPPATNIKALILDMIASRSEEPLGKFIESTCSHSHVSRCKIRFKKFDLVVESPYVVISNTKRDQDFVLVTFTMKNGETELRLCPEHGNFCGRIVEQQPVK